MALSGKAAAFSFLKIVTKEIEFYEHFCYLQQDGFGSAWTFHTTNPNVTISEYLRSTNIKYKVLLLQGFDFTKLEE